MVDDGCDAWWKVWRLVEHHGHQDRVAVYKVVGSGSDQRPLQPAVGTGPTDSDRAVLARADFSTQREVDERVQKASTTAV